jgi:catechol 2,3-dioxygenase-like lactoylglutathione lyase family enzyme
MPLTKLEHYLVLSDDIDATRDFYVEALGMQVGFRPPLGFPGHWVYIGATPVIHIAEWVTYTARSKDRGVHVSARAAGTGPVDHLAFAAQDYDEVLARLERLGVPVRANNNPANTVRQLFLFDPNGVKIEINFRK